MKQLFVMILMVPGLCWGWGKTGHRVVGDIAQKHLNDLAKLQLRKILGHEKLPESSVWPDRIKSDPKLRKTYNHWHYLKAKKGMEIANRKTQKNGDILTAIDHFSKILKNSKESHKNRLEAVRFLTHLVGDLHQPLHTGYAEDRGGNSIKLKWFGKDTTLHNIWDENLIDLEELSYTEYSSKINRASKKLIKKWQATKPVVWAQESRDYLSKVYVYKQKKYWEYDYSYKHLNFLNERLLKAGIRLAGLLNNLLK